MGVGNELRGDDGAGPAVVKALRYLPHRDDLLLIDAGGVPENFTSPLRRFAPSHVLLVDAAQLDADPGEVRWLSASQTGGLTSATHSLPFAVLAEYLARELGCRVAILGIQPLQDELGSRLSTPVKRSAASLAEILAEEI